MRLVMRWEVTELIKLANIVGDQLTGVEYRAHATTDFIRDIYLECVPGNVPFDPIMTHGICGQCSRGTKMIPVVLLLVDQDVLTDI